MRWWSSATAQLKRVFRPGAARRQFSESGPIDMLLRGAWAQSYLSAGPVSREEAMTAAPVQRGRDELCSIATLPLVNFRGLDVVPRAFLEQPDPDVPTVVMMAQTLEDLLCDGISWWLKTGVDYRGFPTTARRVVNVSLTPPARNAGRQLAPLPSGQDPRGASVWVDGHEVPAALMIRFDAPTRPLLSTAWRVIRRAILLDGLAAMYAENPRPLETFTDTDNQTVIPFTNEQVDAFLAEYASGRRRGGPAFIPKQVMRNDVSAPSPGELQLVELQRQVSLELALAMGLDPEDLGVSTTSRTYFNAQDRTNAKINRTFGLFMRAITDRLSMGDVTPRGQGVRFDLTEWLKPDPASQVTYWRGLYDMGAMSAAEIRAAAGLSGPVPAAAAVNPGPALSASVNYGIAGNGIPVITTAPARLAIAGAGTYAGQPAPFHFAAAEFAGARPSARADVGKRTITGLAVPYGARAVKYGVGFRFLPGSLEFDRDNLHRIRVMDGHTTYVGVHESVVDAPEGPTVTLKILDAPANSPAKHHRDQLLMDAEGGLADGLSVGVDFDLASSDVVWDEESQTYNVVRATWLETSVTPDPAFTGARVTKVAASRTGDTMNCQHCGRAHPAGIACQTYALLNPAPPQPAMAHALPAGFNQPAPAPVPTPPAPQPVPGQPAPAPGVFSAAELTAALTGVVQQMIDGGQVATAAPQATAVNPGALPIPGTTAGTPGAAGFTAQVREPAPYRLVFDRKSGEYQMHAGSHDFSRDLIAALKDGDATAHTRALSFVQANFNVATTDVDELNPTRQRPEMFVDQADYTTPLWDSVYKGPLTDITPFAFPKWSSASGLVAAHTEGTEPTTGSYVVTNQTVTPGGYSGKARINREVWDQGGNPQASTLIWNQMVRGAREAWEALVVTTLNAGSFTALATLTAGVTDRAVAGRVLGREMENGIALLQFARGGLRWRVGFAQADLYMGLKGAETTTGEPLYPIIGPSNRNGQASTLFGTIDMGGIPFLPAWALAAVGQTAATKSYLVDPGAVHAWASAPQRLTLDQVAVAYIDLGIWGYQAAAVSDTNGVRTITWDPVA
jgi:hypothetical protein